MVRYSKQDDLGQIQELIQLSFGDRPSALEDLENRYLVYEIDNKIVAITGLYTNTEYIDGLEIDWTCTHPDHRQRGYMQELFKELLKDVTCNVYCSCWRLEDADRVNLQTIMNMFGFEEVLKPRVVWASIYNCLCVKNKYFCVNSKEGCKCCEDLYLRKGER